jgi:hypothetical protein
VNFYEYLEQLELTRVQEHIKEAKRAGIVYHFSTLDVLNKLSDDEIQNNIGCKVFEFLSKNTHLSTTRSYIPPMNFINAADVRIVIDVARLLDNEQKCPSGIKVLPYILNVDILVCQGTQEAISKIENKLDALGISYRKARKWYPYIRAVKPSLWVA